MTGHNITIYIISYYFIELAAFSTFNNYFCAILLSCRLIKNDTRDHFPDCL